MKPILATNHKFVKGQTLYLIDLSFYISVRKVVVKSKLREHYYESIDPWGVDESEWIVDDAIEVLENGSLHIITLESLSYENTLVTTSARSAFKFVRKLTNDVDHFNLTSNAFFNTRW